MLLQDPNDLLFTKPALLHLLPSSQIIYERTPDSNGGDFRGHVNTLDRGSRCCTSESVPSRGLLTEATRYGFGEIGPF
jgi:hypothetical protein